MRLTKRIRINRAIAFRARIVLACADASDAVVAQRLRTTKTTVAKWRSQFVARRLAGLYDEPRVGAPRTITDATVEAIIVKTLETTPSGETHWSTRSMAKAAGISHTMVGRICRTFRLQPHRVLALVNLCSKAEVAWAAVFTELAQLPRPFAVWFEASAGYRFLFARLHRIARRVVVAHPG